MALSCGKRQPVTSARRAYERPAASQPGRPAQKVTRRVFYHVFDDGFGRQFHEDTLVSTLVSAASLIYVNVA